VVVARREAERLPVEELDGVQIIDLDAEVVKLHLARMKAACTAVNRWERKGSGGNPGHLSFLQMLRNCRSAAREEQVSCQRFRPAFAQPRLQIAQGSTRLCPRWRAGHCTGGAPGWTRHTDEPATE